VLLQLIAGHLINPPTRLGRTVLRARRDVLYAASKVCAPVRARRDCRYFFLFGR